MVCSLVKGGFLCEFGAVGFGVEAKGREIFYTRGLQGTCGLGSCSGLFSLDLETLG